MTCLAEPWELSTGKRQPTKRALDAGGSAAFSSSFLALSFLCSQAESTPTPAPAPHR